jgi:hypothetical protein
MAVMMAMPVSPVPVMMVVMMPMPAHVRPRLLFGILLHGRRSARIDQRHRPRALDWNCDHKHRADSRKTQNFRSIHSISPSTRFHAATRGFCCRQQRRRDQIECWDG